MIVSIGIKLRKNLDENPWLFPESIFLMILQYFTSYDTSENAKVNTQDWSDLLNNLKFLIMILYFTHQPLLTSVCFFHDFFQIEFSDDFPDMRLVRTLKSKGTNWSGFTLKSEAFDCELLFHPGPAFSHAILFWGHTIQVYDLQSKPITVPNFFPHNEFIVRRTFIKSNLMVDSSYRYLQ